MSGNEQGRQEGDALKRLRRLLEAESSDGLELLRNLADNPICSVSYDAGIPCIAVLWKRYATSTQLRFVHESIIPLIVRRRASMLLGDDTALPMIHVEDQRWIVQNWMPRAVKAGLKVAASKSPASYFGKLSVATVMSEAPAGLVLRSFDDMDDARRWLRSLSP